LVVQETAWEFFVTDSALQYEAEHA
jgi:hypothetical protein